MLSLISLSLLVSSTLSLPINLAVGSNTTFANTVQAISASSNTTQTVTSSLYTFNSSSPGACNFTTEISDLVVSLPLDFQNSTGAISSYCGSFVILNSNITQKTLTVRVVDLAKDSTMGLSSAVVTALNSTVESLGKFLSSLSSPFLKS